MFRKALSSSVKRVNVLKQNARFSTVESPTGKTWKVALIASVFSYTQLDFVYQCSLSALYMGRWF